MNKTQAPCIEEWIQTHSRNGDQTLVGVPPEALADLLQERDALGSLEHIRLLRLLADIRAAAGDPEGRLMQDELVQHIRKLRDEKSQPLEYYVDGINQFATDLEEDEQ